MAWKLFYICLRVFSPVHPRTNTFLLRHFLNVMPAVMQTVAQWLQSVLMASSPQAAAAAAVTELDLSSLSDHLQAQVKVVQQLARDVTSSVPIVSHAPLLLPPCVCNGVSELAAACYLALVAGDLQQRMKAQRTISTATNRASAASPAQPNEHDDDADDDSSDALPSDLLGPVPTAEQIAAFTQLVR